MTWTDNDYDTLRHEAHHVIQDCLDGINNVQSYYFESDKLKEFVKNSLTEKQIGRIIKTTKRVGGDDNESKMELEAFRVSPEL